MFENSRRGRQARNSTTNFPKILDLKSSSEQVFSRKLPLSAPETSEAKFNEKRQNLDSDSKKGKQNYKQSKNVE